MKFKLANKNHGFRAGGGVVSASDSRNGFRESLMRLCLVTTPYSRWRHLVAKVVKVNFRVSKCKLMPTVTQSLEPKSVKYSRQKFLNKPEAWSDPAPKTPYLLSYCRVHYILLMLSVTSRSNENAKSQNECSQNKL